MSTSALTSSCCLGCRWIRTMRLSRFITLALAILFLTGLIVIFNNWPEEAARKRGGSVATGVTVGVAKGGAAAAAAAAPFVHADNAGAGHDPAIDLARKTLGLIEWTQLSGPELHARLEDLVRIKHSVQGELRSLESQKAEMQLQVSELNRKIDEMKVESSRHHYEMERLKNSINQAKLAVQELAERNTPDLLPPLRLTALDAPQNSVPILLPVKSGGSQCDMARCFDWSRCPISSGFPVFLMNSDRAPKWVVSSLNNSGYRTFNAGEACLYLMILGNQGTTGFSPLYAADLNGSNVLLLDMADANEQNVDWTKFHRAMVLSSNKMALQLRNRFDFMVPSSAFDNEETEDMFEPWQLVPPMIPLRRKYLFSYHAAQPSKSSAISSTAAVNADDTVVYDKIRQTLEAVNFDRTDDRVSVNFTCHNGRHDLPSRNVFDLCGDKSFRKAILAESTFAVIVYEESSHHGSRLLQTRLSEALQQGSIPVIICVNTECSVENLSQVLPFSEVVDYKRTGLMLPLARIPELHFMLRSVPDSDLFSLRNQGRQVWTNYLSSGSKVLATALNVVRTRVGLPAPPFEEAPSPKVFDEENPPLLLDQLPSLDQEPGESLGPLEPPSPSPTFKRNFSATLAVDAYHQWNTHWGSAFRMAPQNPWDPLLPTDAKFLGSGSGFRPINGGEGGSGNEFSQALGGNSPQEHFTVVMLTYEREQVLIDSLSRLYGLPYLNKVIVVWNNPVQPPSADLKWPDIGVPVVVVRAERNSLNNRFLPFDEIDTEAVLSVDDDAHLRHDEIIFGFRVWREHRDRLVGFPGRFHAWDTVAQTAWNYNSNYSCELSMVLTGAAFYHKYYSYAYSQLMPEAIRNKVDEYMNCEDIAMNFLISHMTRAPPVKVTSRWTFRCPGCPVTLSEDDSHFQERHKCINFFAKVYGYMPLLYTQYRADSVLFKTRIPQDKQKCFKFI